MSKRQFLKVRLFAVAALAAALSILSLVSTVLADGGGVPFPK